MSAQAWTPPQQRKPQLTSITATLPSQSSSISDDIPVDGIGVPAPTPVAGTPTTYFFDAVMRIDHDQTLRITDHPVQNGASITDHAYLLPARVVLDIGMSDSMASFQNGQYSGGSSRSVNAYQTMLNIQSLRVPLMLATRLKQYSNMLIEEVRASDTSATFGGARFIVVLRQIIMATVTSTTQSARPQQTTQTPTATLSPTTPSPSDQTLINQFQSGILP